MLDALRTRLENAVLGYGCTLSYRALEKQRDDLLRAARVALPFIDSTRHGRKAAAELMRICQKCEEGE